MGRVRTYYFNEGRFDLAGSAFEDKTTHFLELEAADGVELGLMVCRSKMTPGKTLADMVASYVAQERKRFPGYALLASRELTVAGLDAIDLASEWSHPDGLWYQHQTHLQLGDVWMFFALASPATLRETCDECLAFILRTFRPRPEE